MSVESHPSQLRLFAYRVKHSLQTGFRSERTALTKFVMLDVLIRAIAARERTLLEKARTEHAAEYAMQDNPLISITMATYNRGELLTTRTLPSVFAQTYQNFEIVIRGDGCPDNTAALLQKIDDPRLHFYDLPRRGNYPKNPKHRHMVAGYYPIVQAQRDAQGAWIAHLDDDEIWTPDHLEASLRFAQQHSLEFVSSHARVEMSPGNWELMLSQPFSIRQGRSIPHSSVLFRRYLRLFRPHKSAWRYGLGGDWHCFMRMYYAGVVDGVLDKVTLEIPLRPGTTRPWAGAEDRT